MGINNIEDRQIPITGICLSYFLFCLQTKEFSSYITLANTSTPIDASIDVLTEEYKNESE